MICYMCHLLKFTIYMTSSFKKYPLLNLLIYNASKHSVFRLKTLDVHSFYHFFIFVEINFYFKFRTVTIVMFSKSDS